MARPRMDRETRALDVEVRDALDDLGVRLSGCGLATIANLLGGIQHHEAMHGRNPSATAIVYAADEIMARWVLQRLEHDPRWLDKARKAVVPQVDELFQDEPPELKVT